MQRDAGGLVPLHLIFAEIISSSGAGKHWPQMGDRKVDSSLLVAEFREIEDALEAF